MLTALQDFATAAQLPPPAAHAVDLCLEEHITNILQYGYPGQEPGDRQIVVRFQCEGNELTVEVEDDGRPFNPLEWPALDTSVPAQQRPLGGLGIHLIRSFMDALEYRNETGRNILTMRKRLRPDAV